MGIQTVKFDLPTTLTTLITDSGDGSPCSSYPLFDFNSLGIDTPCGNIDTFTNSINQTLVPEPMLNLNSTTAITPDMINYQMQSFFPQGTALNIPTQYSMQELFSIDLSKFSGLFGNFDTSNGLGTTHGIKGQCINYTNGEYTPADRRVIKRNNDDYIAELQPVVRAKIKMLEAYAKANNIPFRIISGYRTAEDQNRLRKQYANQKGRAAGTHTSPHRSGRAIDIKCSGLLTEAQSTKLGLYAESIGLRWGGRFKKVRERWHFDMPGIKA